MGNNMNQMQMNPNNMNMTNNMMPQNYPNMPTGPVQVSFVSTKYKFSLKKFNHKIQFMNLDFKYVF